MSCARFTSVRTVVQIPQYDSMTKTHFGDSLESIHQDQNIKEKTFLLLTDRRNFDGILIIIMLSDSKLLHLLEHRRRIAIEGQREVLEFWHFRISC